MKQKDRFVKAGPAAISIVYPPAFKELCRSFDIAPESAINSFIKELSFCAVHFSEKTESQAFAALLFSTMSGAIDGMPDEPSLKKKKIGSHCLLTLMEANEEIKDPVKLATDRRKIIKKWYLQYQKRCVCIENL